MRVFVSGQFSWYHRTQVNFSFLKQTDFSYYSRSVRGCVKHLAIINV